MANLKLSVTGPLTHWPTDSPNYKEMLSHLKKIFRFFSLGLRVYNGHSAQHAIFINSSSSEGTILRIKEKQKLSSQEGQQGAPRSRQPE